MLKQRFNYVSRNLGTVGSYWNAQHRDSNFTSNGVIHCQILIVYQTAILVETENNLIKFLSGLSAKSVQNILKYKLKSFKIELTQQAV